MVLEPWIEGDGHFECFAVNHMYYVKRMYVFMFA